MCGTGRLAPAVAPLTAKVRVDNELFHWKQPGMPIGARSSPGLSGASPNTISPSAVPAGISDVRSTTVLPSTGRGLPASASACDSTAVGDTSVKVAASVADRSRLPGSADGPPGE